jgi:hypothetical protein
MMLDCFVAIEAFMFDPVCDLKHNLFEVAYPILQELQLIRNKSNNSLGLLKVNQKDFINPTQKLRPLINQYCFTTFLPKDYEDEVPKVGEKEKKLFDPETIKLLAEEIPWIVASEEDHTLKNPVPVKRTRRNSVAAKETKAQLEKAETLIRKIEELSEQADEAAVKHMPWHKLLLPKPNPESQ